MLATIPKAFIYLTRAEGDLLLMAHPDHPEAGLQVPAGTIQDRETPEQAAIRELSEETGLSAFRIEAYLGETTYDMRPFGKPEFHRRFFFHALLVGTAADRWFNVERHGGASPIRFEFFWWNLADGAPRLIAGHGDLLGCLAQRRCNA